MTHDFDRHDQRSGYGHKGRKEKSWGSMYGPYIEKFMRGSCRPSGFGKYQYSTPEGNYVRTPHATVEFDNESNTYNIVIELPGISKDNIDLKATEDSLKITGTRKSIREPEKDIQYKRRFDFKRNIITESISAKFNEGLLNVILLVKEKPTSTVNIN